MPSYSLVNCLILASILLPHSVKLTQNVSFEFDLQRHDKLLQENNLNHHHNPSECLVFFERIQNGSFSEFPAFCIREASNLNFDVSTAVRVLDEIKDPKALQKLMESVGSLGGQQVTEMVSQLKSKDLSESKAKAVVGPLVESLGGAQNLSPENIRTFGSKLLRSMPGQFIKELSQESLNTYIDDVFENGTASPEDILTREEGTSLCKRTFQFYRGINSLEDFDKILPVLTCAPVSVCKAIPQNILDARLASITQLPWNCESSTNRNDDDRLEKLKEMYPQMGACAKSLLRRLADPRIFNLEIFNNLGTLRSCLEKQHYLSLVRTANCTVLYSIAGTNNVFRYSSVKRAMKNKCENSAVNQPGNLTAATLLEMGPLAVELGKNVLKQLPEAALCDSGFISMVKSNRNTPARMRKIVARRCFTNRTLTTSDITDMGSDIMLKLGINQLIESVGSNNVVLDTNTRNELKIALKAGKGDRRIKTLRRELQKKFPVKDLLDSPEIMKEMPLNRLRSEVVDIRQDLGLDDNSTTVDLPDTVSKWGIAQWLRNTSVENITADMLQEMKTLVRGFLSSHISGLNRDDLLYSASVLCEISDWPSKTAQAIARDLIIEYLKDENSANYMSALTVTDVSVIGPECLMFLRPTELEQSAADVCVAICEKLGSSDRTLCLPHERRSLLKESCLKCIGKTGSASITEDDLDILGYSLATELRSEFSRISASVIRNRVSTFRHGCLSGHFLNGISSKLREAYGSASDLDAEDILELGALLEVYTIDTNFINDINETILADVAEEIIAEINPQDEKIQQNLKCCLRGLSDSELVELESAKSRVYDKLTAALDSSLIVSRRRRKRDSSTWTCDDVRSMGATITSVSTADLQAIDSTEFYNCLGDMSQYTDWETSKRDALLVKVQSEVDSVCNLTTSDVVNVGYFLLSMTLSEIDCLSLVEDDVVATVGSFNEWTSDQLNRLAVRYLDDRSVGVENLTESDVAILGNLLCGFQTADLGQLSSAAYIGASVQIGRLSACDAAHLQTLKGIASRSDTLGSISSWGADTYSEIGVIIGGFTGPELQALSTDHIEGIPSHAVPHIPGTVLSSLSVQQLSSFSFEQADAVSDDQRVHLSQEQSNAVQSAVNLGEQQSPQGGSGITGITLGSVLHLVFMAIWVMFM